MNNILNNLAIILLLIGIIFITIYITKASFNGFKTFNETLLFNNYNKLQRRNPLSIYDYRVSKEYKKMFSQPSIWFGYEDFDENDSLQKLYIK